MATSWRGTRRSPPQSPPATVRRYTQKITKLRISPSNDILDKRAVLELMLEFVKIAIKYFLLI